MPTGSKARRRSRGEIETLPSGSLRVRVYAGIDPVSKKRHYLVETVPAGPTAAKQAEKVRTRLLNEVDEKRNPKTKATVDRLMDRYFELVDIDETTRVTYEGYARNHIRPLLGHLPLGRLDGETLDSFYAQLRTCRAHCRGRRFVEHRVADEHECDDRCRLHVCSPLADNSIRQIHAVLKGACARAVRWRWLGTNPVDQVDPPAAGTPDPQPPSPEQAARIANEAWRDPDWGMLVWISLMTGARRGEVCALSWDRIDFGTGVVTIRSSIAQLGSKTWEKDTKTHQRRHITLDDGTMALLRAYRKRCEEQAEALDIDLPPKARVFSRAPDGSSSGVCIIPACL